MNRIFSHLPLALASLALLSVTSCDDIDLSERVVAGTTNEYDRTFETSQIEVEGETFNINDEHSMLLMDFTGWLCINCPNVANFLTTKVTSVYPTVLVSMHMNTNSFSANNVDGYNCPSADSIADWINGSAIASQLPLPSVSVDNCEYNGSLLNSNTTDIENLVSRRFKECNVDKTAPQANLSVNVHDLGNGSYDLSTLVIYPNAKQATLRLWLIEEGLISRYQASSTGAILNYENHGILRQVVNGAHTGQNIQLDAQGYHVQHTRLNLNPAYIASNCYVVAVLTDVNGRTIINCVKAPLANQ